MKQTLKSYRILYLFFIFLTFSLTSKSQDPKKTDQLLVANHILINRDLSYPGDLLCHNNIYLFFKSENACKIANSDPADCSNLLISPIRQLERIDLNKSQQSWITRFYRIETKYKVVVFEKEALDSYKFSKEIDTSVGLCTFTPIAKENEIIETRRPTYDKQESQLLKNLFDSGIDVINSPEGYIFDLDFANFESANIDTNRIEFETLSANIRSPRCNALLDPDLIHLLGGEVSGNGVSPEQFDWIENFSMPVQYTDMSDNTVGCQEGVWL